MYRASHLVNYLVATKAKLKRISKRCHIVSPDSYIVGFLDCSWSSYRYSFITAGCRDIASIATNAAKNQVKNGDSWMMLFSTFGRISIEKAAQRMRKDAFDAKHRDFQSIEDGELLYTKKDKTKVLIITEILHAYY